MTTKLIPFSIAQYDLFEAVVLANKAPTKVLMKRYNLTEKQIRKIIHKDSTVTEEQYLKWIKGN